MIGVTQAANRPTTITITTLLFFYVVRHLWRRPLWVVLVGASSFLLLELLFLAANLTKVTHGAWLPLLIGITAFTVLTTWQRGRAPGDGEARKRRGVAACVRPRAARSATAVKRVPGTAVFLNRTKTTTPLAMRANVEQNHILHQRVVILSIETMPMPYVATANRIKLDALGYTDDGISHVSARFGYMGDPNVPAAVRQAAATGGDGPLDLDDRSYFLSTIELRVGDAPGMTR